MGSCCEMSEEEEDCFFDTREDISSSSDSGSDCAETCGQANSEVGEGAASGGFGYEIWVQNLDSVRERRNKFLKLMGLDSEGGARPAGNGAVLRDDASSEGAVDVGRITESSGAVLRNSCFIDGFSSSRSSSGSIWSNEGHSFSEDGFSEENFRCRIKNLDDGSEFIVDEWAEDGNFSKLRHVGSNRLYTVEEFQRSLGLSPLIQRFMQREVAGGSDSDASINSTSMRRKHGWLKKLGVVACVVDRQKDEGSYASGDSDASTRAGSSIVRVRASKKSCKELSALYRGQEIEAHVGPILTMKFSLDGKYLASGGGDGVVRVWQVIESKSGEHHHLPADPGGVCFMLNKSSELTPIFVEKEKIGKGKKTKRSAQSACVILPPAVFRLSDKPVHEFLGHNGDVLDLSWSRSQCLLSSSVDKTVRLWKVGCSDCLKVFSHHNYVTCVQFNPVDENNFISGSIDGKARIWDIKERQVVDWTDVRDIVTAVCYRPDGQGGIIGSMTGNCRFYNASGNRLLLDAEICLQGKKKSSCNRITGFEYSPTDPEKIMVTSADSQVRILDGRDIACKYKGLRNSGSQIAASFSSDGRHIISASEDSNVYIWNYDNQDGPGANQSKSIWSCERFFSSHVSVAIPWSGSKSEASVSISSRSLDPRQIIFRGVAADSEDIRGFHSEFVNNGKKDRFSLNHGFFSDLIPKGSATWPEEKLSTANTLTVSSVKAKSHFKFLKTSCQNTTSSHAWGMVIVTAGWDGRIRSFLNYGLPLCV